MSFERPLECYKGAVCKLRGRFFWAIPVVIMDELVQGCVSVKI